MAKKLSLLAVLCLMGVSFAQSQARADAPPVNDHKCPVPGATGTDVQGHQCVCAADPDGDPYNVWVCH
jgi:hypothetical protein